MVTFSRPHGWRQVTHSNPGSDFPKLALSLGTFPDRSPKASTQLPATETALLFHMLPHSLSPYDAGRGHLASAPKSEGPSYNPCSPGGRSTPRLRAGLHPRTHRSRPTPLCPEAALPRGSAQSDLKTPRNPSAARGGDAETFRRLPVKGVAAWRFPAAASPELISTSRRDLLSSFLTKRREKHHSILEGRSPGSCRPRSCGA